MGLVDGLKKAISTAREQITSSSPKPQGIYFTNNFQQKAKQWHVGEKDALDVFYYGTEDKPGMKTRKYNGYELSIYYGTSKSTGQPAMEQRQSPPRQLQQEQAAIFQQEM